MRTPLKLRRTNRVQFNLTDDELKHVNAEAQKSGLRRSDYCRHRVLVNPTPKDKAEPQNESEILARRTRAVEVITKLGTMMGISTQLPETEFHKAFTQRVNDLWAQVEGTKGERSKLKKQIADTISALAPNPTGDDVVTLARKRMGQIRQHGEHHREIVNALGINVQTNEGEGYVIHADILKAIEHLTTTVWNQVLKLARAYGYANHPPDRDSLIAWLQGKLNELAAMEADALRSLRHPDHKAFFGAIMAWARRQGYDGPTELGKTEITKWLGSYLKERERIIDTLGSNICPIPPHSTDEIIEAIETLKKEKESIDQDRGVLWSSFEHLHGIAKTHGYKGLAIAPPLVTWLEAQLRTLDNMRASEEMRSLAPPSKGDELKRQVEAFLEIFCSISRINPAAALLHAAKYLEATDPCNRTFTGLAAWLRDIAEAYYVHLVDIE